jgi:hypothetical protein
LLSLERGGKKETRKKRDGENCESNYFLSNSLQLTPMTFDVDAWVDVRDFLYEPCSGMSPQPRLRNQEKVTLLLSTLVARE